MADKLGMGNSNFGHIENDRVVPTSASLDRIADLLGTSTDYLLGRGTTGYAGDRSAPTPEEASLSDREERDIADDLERLIQQLDSGQALAFRGEPMDEATRERMRQSLEQSMKLAKRLAKSKFTPKSRRPI